MKFSKATVALFVAGSVKSLVVLLVLTYTTAVRAEESILKFKKPASIPKLSDFDRYFEASKAFSIAAENAEKRITATRTAIDETRKAFEQPLANADLQDRLKDFANSQDQIKGPDKSIVAKCEIERYELSEEGKLVMEIGKKFYGSAPHPLEARVALVIYENSVKIKPLSPDLLAANAKVRILNATLPTERISGEQSLHFQINSHGKITKLELEASFGSDSDKDNLAPKTDYKFSCSAG